MLIEADSGGEGKMRADADEHSSPAPIVDTEVVLNDPAVGDLEIPAVGGLVADSNHDACRFARFEDDHNLVGLGPIKIGLDEFVNVPYKFFLRTRKSWDDELAYLASA